MARALIVGCGCRGRELGVELVADGWLVRGTTRDPARLGEIEAAGIEAALVDPGKIGDVLDHVADVTLLFWLMGTASGDVDVVAALHGSRLERLIEELVDTPVRGVVYEAAGSVAGDVLERGVEVVEYARATWRIPAAVIAADPADSEAWRIAMLAAASRFIAG